MNKRVNKITFVLIFAIAMITTFGFNISNENNFSFGINHVVADDGGGDGGGSGGDGGGGGGGGDGGGGGGDGGCCGGDSGGGSSDSGGGGGGSVTTTTVVVNTCSNGATNYPTCNNNVCTNGATNYPTCNNNVCTNGATNYPYCNNNYCSNGATNYPTCNNNVCTNGATNYPFCNNNVCTNGATNYPTCNNNVCSNGATNYPTCNNNTCSNGATNYPYCYTNTCSNGYTNYPTCGPTTCTNGATNFPACNNNINYTYCNGIQYYFGYSCPNYQNNLSVSTTGATGYTTTATIYGFVNPYSANSTIWFDYGTNPNSLQWQTTKQSTSYAGQFSAALTGLQCGTRYYYRAAAQNSYTVKYGQTLSFVTQNCNYNNSTVVTRLATAVGYYSAQFNGSYVTSTTYDKTCQAFFDYGTTYSLGKRTSGQSLYNNYTVNYFSQAVSGLSPNTIYYYRAGVTCYDGTKYGNIVSFKTPAYIKRKVIVTPIAKTEVKQTATCMCDDDFMTLTAENLETAVVPGKLANFKVVFKNTSKENLKDVAIRVVLPEEFTIYSVDKGQYTKGGKSVLITIPLLPSMAEGMFIVTVNVDANTKIGNQMVTNVYADFTVPTIIKSGVPVKGEVTGYVISIAGDTITPAFGGINVNSQNNTSTNSWFAGILPTNFMEWLIAILVFIIFISAVRYVFGAFKNADKA